MLGLVTIVLFLHHVTHCGADGHDSHKPYSRFDDELHQTIYAAQRDNYMESMTSMFKTINTYESCLVTSKQQWENLLGPSHFPKICGSIGYIQAEPVSLVWTLETYSALLLNVTYLELPFLGFGCPSTRLIISVFRGVFCGRRSHWEVYSPSDIKVWLEQYIRLPGSSGFVATYFAIDITSIHKAGTKYRLESAPGGWYAKTTPLFHNHNGLYNVAPEFSWHFVTKIYNVIHIKVENNTACQIYDGPGRLSPLLHDVNQSSAFHLYVVQHNPHHKCMFEYFTALPTSFSTKQHVGLSSHPNRNTVYRYQVTENDMALRINFLSIHSLQIVTDVPGTKCVFGGLFINLKKLIDVCNTNWKKEVYIHLTDGRPMEDDGFAQMHISVIVYGSYADGKVALSVDLVTEYCDYGEQSHGSPDLDRNIRCNQFLYVVPYKPNFSFSPMFRFTRSGPIDLKIHILPLIYDLYDIQFNITVWEANILGFDRITHTDTVETRAHLRYQNPDQFSFKEIHGNYFATWRLAIIKFTRKALCDYTNTFNELYMPLTDTQMITLNPYEARCRLAVDGLTEYNVAIVATDNNINVAVSFNEQCAAECHDGKITFTEYSTIYDSLIIHNFTSFPASWENIHTNNSVQMNIRVSHRCRSCTLLISVGPGERATFQHNLHLSPQKMEKIKTHRLVHPTR